MMHESTPLSIRPPQFPCSVKTDLIIVHDAPSPLVFITRSGLQPSRSLVRSTNPLEFRTTLLRRNLASEVA